MTVRAPKVSTREARTIYGLAIAQILAILGGGYAFAQILRRTSRRQPFASENVAWLRMLAVFVALGGFVVPFAIHRFEIALIDRYRPTPVGGERAPLDPLHAGPGVAPITIVLMVLAFAEIWRLGIRLREDAEATI